MKSIFKKVTLLVLMFGLVFALFGCKKNDAKALENYLLKQDKTVVSADFVLDAVHNFNDKEYELTWTSSSDAIQLEKRDKDYLAKINFPDQETVVTLTVKLGKATKEFTVTVQPIDVYNFSQSYVFPKDKQIVTESFDLDTSCAYAGKTATIAWSVDEAYADYIAISEDGARCLVFPSSVDTEVKIKGTFTYNNETTTKQYRMTVSKTKTAEEQVDYWYSNTGISQVISGYVVAKGNWKEYQGVYEAIICVLDDSGLCGYYLYLEPTDINKEAFEAMPLGTHVTNTGSVNTNYNGLQETTNYKGKTVLDNDIEVKQITPFAIDNDLIAGGPVATYMTSTLVSLTNWEVKEVKEWSVSGSTNTILIVTKGGVDVPIVTSKYFLIEPDSLSTDTTVIPAIQASVKDLKAGDFVNIKGILSNYKGPQIVANSADSITLGVADTTAAADLPGSLVKALMVTNKEKAPKGLVTSNTTIEFAASTDKVTVKYELLGSSNSVSIEGNNVTVTPGKKENSTIKVTYTCGEWSTYELIKISAEKVSAQEMLDAEKAKITNFNVDKTTELASKGETYSEVVITWALKEASEGVAIEAGKLVVGAGLDKDVVLVATLTLGEATETKEVTVHVTTPDLGHNGTPTDPLDAKAAIAMAGQLDGPSKEMSAFAYFVKATIVDDPTAEYCNFHFASGEDQIVVYGLWAANGTDRYGSKREIAELPVKKGDEVVLYAKLQNFQGTLELANAILVSVNGVETGAQIKLTAREAVLIASELDGDAKEKTEARFLFEVTITDDPTAEYCNFHFASGDKEVLVYGLYNNDGTKRYGSKRDIAELPVKKGDKVVLEAKVQNFQGTYELVDAWLISVDKPIVIEHAGTEADPFTVADAILKIEQETNKVNGTYTSAKYYVTGEVKSVSAIFDVKDGDGNVVAKDVTVELKQGDKTIKAQYLLLNDTVNAIYIGDTLTVCGFFEYYNGPSIYPKDKNNYATGEWPTAVAVTRGNGSVAVATDSSEHATVKDLSAQTGANGTTFTFKVEVADSYELDFVKVNGKEVEAVDDVYTATFNGAMTILVGTVEATATERTIEIDFTQLIQEIPASKGTRHSASSVEITAGGITLDLRNVYQSGGSYLILASKLTDADAEGNTSKTPAWVANKTPIPGRIISITVYGNADGNPSGSAVYYLDAFGNAKVEALTTSETTITGLKATPLVYTAAEDANLYYFNLSTTTAANGQITKIVIVYEPGDVPQPQPELQVNYGGAKQGAFEKQQDGTYVARVELGAWNRISFQTVLGETTTDLWYDNTTFSVLIQDEETLGDQWDGKLYHEADDGKRWMPGQASGYKFTYNPETHTMVVSTYIPGGEVRYGGAKQGKFVKNESGLYVATLELAAWNRVSFSVIDEDGNETVLWYDNTTFSGLIQDEATLGDQWDGKLYHEADDGKRWMPGQAAGYKFTYDAQAHTMVVSQYIPGGELTYGGEKQGKFVKGEDNLLTATVSLQQWKRISFALVDEDGNATALWYDNTTFTGKITAADKLGDQWDGSLYHEADDGQRWMPGEGPERTYRFTYNPETRTMNVELLDVTAPVITISDAVMQALAAKEFWAGENEQATFAAFMQGISASDETDGAITVTQEMINLGGLNPANLVGGDYTITITVKDAAGNEAKKEVKIHVKQYANVNLFADHPGSDTAYNSTKWTRENYKNDQWNVISGQMNARTKDGVKVVNMVNGYSVPMRFTYNKDGAALGVANKLTFKVGNYYTGATAMSVKVKLVLANGTEVFIAGDANNWATIPVTSGLIDQELTFDAAEVKSVVFVTRSTNNGSTYLYVGNCVLGYEEPASSPATFQVTNLQAEGNARNHIEGAGAWIWIDPTSIGLTAENLAQFSATATCESINVVRAFFSDYSASAVRCYVELASAPAADATTTIHLTITNGDASYQGQVSFLGNELQ